MKASRRAVPSAPSRTMVVVLRSLIVALASALTGVLGLLGVVSLSMARRVVTPGDRVPDTAVVGIDTSAQTITLRRTDDTVLPGRYGLFTAGDAGYVKLGTVLSTNGDTVTRKLLTHVARGARIAPDAAFSGWYYDVPEQLHLPFTTEVVGGPVGPCPAWVFPAAEPTDTWVIQVHGRGATRAECLRAVPVFHAAGLTTLVVSYRNDGEAVRTPAGTYGLGATEWRDVDAALGEARRRGARRIVVMGWSMGGAIALQLSLNSAHRDLIAGLVLDSPVADWRVVLGHQAQLNRLPRPVATLAMRALQREWTGPAAGVDVPIPFDRLDMVARAAELRHPILILHSDDDGYVPSDASHQLFAARPDLVELEVFRVARHTKLWNYDQDRWSGAICAWLDRHGLSPAAAQRGEAAS
ncbi:alpha/beta hydrolase family protein [Microbacterium sp.]|uniref:alpha/beta hydrolase family protein n=1 Tax=Microbacterium sp. TaxID=51671 RepID=UPI0039E22E69